MLDNIVLYNLYNCEDGQLTWEQLSTGLERHFRTGLSRQEVTTLHFCWEPEPCPENSITSMRQILLPMMMVRFTRRMAR